MFDRLKDIFNEVYLMIYGYEYNFVNKNVNKQILGFIEKMPAGAGDDWLQNFIIFQFAYYAGMKTRFDRIYLNWIFGEKALKRWEERTEPQMYYANLFKIKLGIRHKLEKLKSADYLQLERLRFKDESRKFIHCYDLALFEKNSEHCKMCKFYELCLTGEK